MLLNQILKSEWIVNTQRQQTADPPQIPDLYSIQWEDDKGGKRQMYLFTELDLDRAVPTPPLELVKHLVDLHNKALRG